MFPHFAPGDCVVTFNWGGIKQGDVVAFEVSGISYLKRVDKYIDNYVYN